MGEGLGGGLSPAVPIGSYDDEGDERVIMLLVTMAEMTKFSVSLVIR